MAKRSNSTAGKARASSARATIGVRKSTAKKVADLVRDGSYPTIDAAIERGVHLAGVEGRLKQARLRELSAMAEVGLRDMRAGRGSPADEVFDRVIKRLRGKQGRRSNAA
jgi:Arc/MetJ-type ribon-helix-helix transcriptional regulator